jgi:hypothetical protein
MIPEHQRVHGGRVLGHRRAGRHGGVEDAGAVQVQRHAAPGAHGGDGRHVGNRQHRPATELMGVLDGHQVRHIHVVRVGCQRRGDLLGAQQARREPSTRRNAIPDMAAADAASVPPT